MSERRATFQVTLGRLYWRQARHLSKALKFMGYDLEHIEGPGWIDREFIFRGDQGAIMQVYDWVRDINAASATATGLRNT